MFPENRCHGRSRLSAAATTGAPAGADREGTGLTGSVPVATNGTVGTPVSGGVCQRDCFNKSTENTLKVMTAANPGIHQRCPEEDCLPNPASNMSSMLGGVARRLAGSHRAVGSKRKGRAGGCGTCMAPGVARAANGVSHCLSTGRHQPAKSSCAASASCSVSTTRCQTVTFPKTTASTISSATKQSPAGILEKLPSSSALGTGSGLILWGRITGFRSFMGFLS